jgi:hypothetical protein
MSCPVAGATGTTASNREEREHVWQRGNDGAIGDHAMLEWKAHICR